MTDPADFLARFCGIPVHVMDDGTVMSTFNSLRVAHPAMFGRQEPQGPHWTVTIPEDGKMVKHTFLSKREAMDFEVAWMLKRARQKKALAHLLKWNQA